MAEAHGATWESDAAGNTVVRAAGAGMRGGSAVAIQSHLDMVCEKEPGVDHDFLTDPIRPRREGEMIYASGTTLGADDGIGVAASLALLTTPSLQHGPLELLFTVDEERGLRGALALDPSLLTASSLVNLDSEDPNSLIVGSAGSQDIVVTVPIARERVGPGGCAARSITLSGLRGGHSGMEINEHRGNSLKLIARALEAIRGAGVDFSIASLSGGTARNAIPRSARAAIVLPPSSATHLDDVIGDVRDELKKMCAQAEPELTLEVEDATVPEGALAPTSSIALVSLIEQIPNGVLAVDDHSGEARTSANLARVQTDEDRAELLITTRSSSQDELRDLQAEIAALCADFGGEARVTGGYPPWSPALLDGHLLSVTSRLYWQLTGRRAVIKTIHAGLECGVIAARVPGTEAVSFGPLIRDAHTPSEHVDASTVPPMWKLLVALIERLASEEGRRAA